MGAFRRAFLACVTLGAFAAAGCMSQDMFTTAPTGGARLPHLARPAPPAPAFPPASLTARPVPFDGGAIPARMPIEPAAQPDPVASVPVMPVAPPAINPPAEPQPLPVVAQPPLAPPVTPDAPPQPVSQTVWTAVPAPDEPLPPLPPPQPLRPPVVVPERGN